MEYMHYVRKVANLAAPTENQIKDLVRAAIEINLDNGTLFRSYDAADIPARKNIILKKFDVSMPDELGFVRFRILADIDGYGIRKVQLDINNENYMPRKSLICNVSVSTEKWGMYCMKDNSCFLGVI